MLLNLVILSLNFKRFTKFRRVKKNSWTGRGRFDHGMRRLEWWQGSTIPPKPSTTAAAAAAAATGGEKKEKKVSLSPSQPIVVYAFVSLQSMYYILDVYMFCMVACLHVGYRAVRSIAVFCCLLLATVRTNGVGLFFRFPLSFPFLGSLGD